MLRLEIEEMNNMMYDPRVFNITKITMMIEQVTKNGGLLILVK